MEEYCQEIESDVRLRSILPSSSISHFASQGVLDLLAFCLSILKWHRVLSAACRPT